jgi:hypothetical protein
VNLPWLDDQVDSVVGHEGAVTLCYSSQLKPHSQLLPALSGKVLCCG